MTKKKTLLALALMLGGLAVLIAFFVWKLNADADADLKGELKLAKEEEIWIDSPRDLSPASPAAPGENAAPLYAQALGLGGDPLRSPKGLMLLEQASQRHDFFIDEVQGKAAPIRTQELQRLFQSCNFAVGDEIQLHHPDAALQDLQIAAGLARQMLQNPGLFSPDALEFNPDPELFVLDDLAVWLQQFPKQAARAQVVLDRLGPPPPLEPVLRLRLLSLFHQLEKPLEGKGNLADEAREAMALTLVGLPPYRKRYQAGLVRYFRQVIEAFRQDPAPYRVLRKIGSLDSKPIQGAGDDREGILLLGAYLSSDFQTLAVDLGYRNMLAEAIAILSSGKIPKSLPLQDGTQIDPANGLTLEYAVRRNTVPGSSPEARALRVSFWIASQKRFRVSSVEFAFPGPPLNGSRRGQVSGKMLFSKTSVGPASGNGHPQ